VPSRASASFARRAVEQLCGIYLRAEHVRNVGLLFMVEQAQKEVVPRNG
jgi:hypothetical protein